MKLDRPLAPRMKVYRLPSAAAPASDQEELMDEVADDWEYLSDAAAAEAAAAGAGGGGGGGGGGGTAAAAQSGLGLEGVSLEDAEGGGDGGVAEGDGGGAGDGEGGEGQEGEEEEQESVEVVSERLLAAFLNGLKKTLKDAQLPMLVSTFYSSVLLPSRPPGTSIDVKKTRYRKISNFLKEMEERGLVTLKVWYREFICFDARSLAESASTRKVDIECEPAANVSSEHVSTPKLR